MINQLKNNKNINKIYLIIQKLTIYSKANLN